MRTYDYIIAGAGSAGCVLASRLTESPDVTVLLLEAGRVDWDPYIHVPGAAGALLDSRRNNWNYQTEPQPHLNNRRLSIPRGKVLGGSSSINGMVYIRGHRLDYDRWACEGAPGWSYNEVLPYFRRAEGHTSRRDAFHGKEGPLRVTKSSYQNPLLDAFLAAGRQAGHPATTDFNGAEQEGFGRIDLTIHGGRRCSTARSFLRAARGRPNLTVETGALAEQVLIEKGRAVGLIYRRRNRTVSVRAQREVIVASGAINSPKLLLLSGIGPADELRATGIPVVAELPGVGRNLQDHLEVAICHASPQPVSLYGLYKPIPRAGAILRWLLTRTGPAASSHFEAGAFLRSTPDVEHPDLQYHFMPICLPDHTANAPKQHGYQCIVAVSRPKARGSVRLRSANPFDPPMIDPNYMSEPQDWEVMRAGIRLAREFFALPAFDPFRGPELLPGDAVRSPEAVDAFIREHAVTGHHASGTCRMGLDENAVVDPQCRVRGVEGLRVVDASIMPSITTGNTNAPTIMIAEKASDLIRGNRLPGLPEAELRDIRLSPNGSNSSE